MATPFPPFDGSAPKRQKFSEPPEMGIDPDKRYTATMSTSMGDLVIALDAVKAPATVNNFVFLALNHYYDGVIFHRIINGFMCQGGDPTGTGRGGQSLWGKSFADEVTPDIRFEKPGLLAMANAGPGTNGSQFFITTAKTPWLNMRHTIFGEVDTGYDIVQKIEGLPTDGNDRPVETQKIVTATVIES